MAGKYKKSLVTKKPRSSVAGTLTQQKTEPERPAETIRNNVRFEHIAIGDIITSKVVIEPEEQKELESFLLEHGQIMPVLVRPITKESKKFGAVVLENTGKYEPVVNEKIARSMQDLYNKTGEDRFSLCQAMVVSPSVSEEEIEQIKEEIQSDKSEKKLSPSQIAKLTKDKQIDMLYDFEEVYIEPEKLLDEYNNFDYTEDEIHMLADSILHFGMWELPLILPYISSDKEGKNQVKYRIIAGHKRISAVRYLKQTINDQEALNKLQKIKVRLLPLGSTKEQIDAVHEFSNLMRRQLTPEQGLDHIQMVKGLPPIPTSEEEYEMLINGDSMTSLSAKVEAFFKALGWNNWSNRKTARYLSVYYFGCDRLKEEWKNKDCPLNQTQLVWIATEYKSFDQKLKQEEVLERSLEDNTYLIDLMSQNKKTRIAKDSVPVNKVYNKLTTQSRQLVKFINADLDKPKNEKEQKKIQSSIRELKYWIKELEEKYKKLDQSTTNNQIE